MSFTLPKTDIVVNTLDIRDMLPVKFEPKTVRRFIVCLDGIDSFLFNSIERPNLENRGIFDKLFGLNNGKLVAKIYDSIAPSGEQQLRQWMQCQSFWDRMKLRNELKKMNRPSEEIDRVTAKERELVIKRLDPVGTIISQVKYTGVTIHKIEFELLSYDCNNISSLGFEMKFKKEIFEY